ncbi:MAG: outer membrane beta-barrel protein [Bacteroidales bacterium]|jgi:cytoskeletal protein RodZ|nr:outer membrane beta-barrel protein [Bacteroidales bacterium]HHV00560.1 outer membrane beta-barrel protein [Bacteroidales bacterium]
MSKFDDIFSRKAKEAFENYNADHLAGDGWNSFASRYGKQRRRTIVFPLWARAASIIILVTAGILFMNRFISRNPEEPAGLTAHQSGNEMSDSTEAKADTSAARTATTASVPVIADNELSTRETISGARQTGDGGRRVRQATDTGGLDGLTPDTGNLASGRTGDAQTRKTGNLAAEQTGDAQARKTGNLATGRTRETDSRTWQVRETGSLAAGQSNEPAIAVVTESDKMDDIYAGVNLALNPIEIRLTEKADSRLNLPPVKVLDDYRAQPRQKMTTTLMTGLSGLMASIDNATTTAQGVSIGFYVERQLTRRISVRPGLAMAKHSYGMEGTPEEVLAGANTIMDYAAPELNGLSGTTSSYEADIDLLLMEVPVNFVFSLWRRAEKNFFISTGASTMLYLSQHMTGSFNNTYTKTMADSYGGTTYATKTTTVQVEREHHLLNRVDFLGLANFSAGYSMPFGRGTHLLLEPFVQLPVKDLTSMNLRIRYGGLSMKIQF